MVLEKRQGTARGTRVPRQSAAHNERVHKTNPTWSHLALRGYSFVLSPADLHKIRYWRAAELHGKENGQLWIASRSLNNVFSRPLSLFCRAYVIPQHQRDLFSLSAVPNQPGSNNSVTDLPFTCVCSSCIKGHINPLIRNRVFVYWLKLCSTNRCSLPLFHYCRFVTDVFWLPVWWGGNIGGCLLQVGKQQGPSGAERERSSAKVCHSILHMATGGRRGVGG